MGTTRHLVVVGGALMAACAAPLARTGLPTEDVQAIRQLQSQFIVVCQRSAWTELPPFFTDDVALIHANQPAVHGIEAIRDHYRDLQLRAIEVSAEPCTAFHEPLPDVSLMISRQRRGLALSLAF